MISNINSDYRSICELFNFSKENSADVNKRKLLEIAINKKNKPYYKSKLGKCLQYYTLKCSRCYDPIFTSQLKKIRPDWFKNITSKFKEDLIKIAKNKKSQQPRTTSKLGLALRRYTNKNSKYYDNSFCKKIKIIRPNWDLESYGTENNKKILLQMAKNNKKKPHWNSTLRRVLRNYMNPKSLCFDKNFSIKITKLAPQWFVSSIDFKKKELLRLAKIKKSKKPEPKTTLGRALRRCQYCSYYKSNKQTLRLINQLKKLKPDWFLK